MAAAVPAAGGLRGLPGDLFLVRFELDPGWDHERLLLWPVTNTEWMILTPDGDCYSENLGDYSRVRKMSGKGYPAGVENVVAFELPLTTAQLSEWVTSGRKQARAARLTRHVTLAGPEPTVGIDGWSGERFALPAETVAGRAFNRVVGKKAPIAASQGAATGLTAIDDSPGKAAAAAAAKSPLGAGDKSAGAPDPAKLFDAFEPLDGKSWVCIDPLRSDKYFLRRSGGSWTWFFAR